MISNSSAKPVGEKRYSWSKSTSALPRLRTHLSISIRLLVVHWRVLSISHHKAGQFRTQPLW